MTARIIFVILLTAAPLAGWSQTAAPAPAGTASAPSAETSTPAAPWLTTLQTDTPQQGFDLALSMARHVVKAAQPDMAMLKEQRPAYSTDAARLIDVSGVVAAWFATIAAANDYWRE